MYIHAISFLVTTVLQFLFGYSLVTKYKLHTHTNTHTHTYIYIYIITVMFVIISLREFVADQMQYTLESAQYL